ncbi:MAG: thioredoxin [Crocosphaera sp.]|nr:thioredoxin [Crocosphaera sp.]
MTKATFIQDNEINELLADSLPVVVDYTATWCGPCRVISPFIDQLAKEYEGRAKVFKIDLDQNKENAKKYGIRSIPAVLIFKGGEVVEHLVGKANYETFKEALEKHL